MSDPELLSRLRELHEELASINEDLTATEDVDQDTVDALGQLATDVGGLVDKAKTEPSAATGSGAAANLPDEHSELMDQIKQFESKHPRVTRFLSQMTDILVSLGI